MFPDFPEYKSRIQKLLLRRVQNAIKEIAPVLGEIHTFRQHEGSSGVLARSDGSTDVMDFPEITSELKLSHEEMKSLSLEQVAERLQSVARDFASAQMKLMVKKVSEAADTVGNTVSAGGGDFTPELFFEMIRKIRIDFDPEPELLSFQPFWYTQARGINYGINWNSGHLTLSSTLNTQKFYRPNSRNGVLERILENWLTSLNERGYEIPFTQLLSAEGFRVLHGPVHHPFEHGKDILALSQSGDLCAFQLKGGDIDLAELESIQGQLLALCATAVTYPGVEPPRRPDRVALVTNGKLTPPARGRIEAFNHGNRPLGLPVLECIEGEHLVGRFKDAHQQYLPSTPRDLNMFLNLYLADGNGPFPTDEFFVFVNSLIAPAIKSGPRRQIKRALASMVLFTAYTTSPWDRSKNHVGIAEAWLSGALTILQTASEAKFPEEEWLSSYMLALEGGRTALADLLAEAAAREDLLIPDLAEGLVYPVRCLITCGYLAAFSISESLLVGGNDHRDQVQKVISREISYLVLLCQTGSQEKRR